MKLNILVSRRNNHPWKVGFTYIYIFILILKHFYLKGKYFLQKIIRNALDTLVNKFNVNDKTSEFLSKAKEEVFENMWISMAEEMEAANKLDAKYFTIPDHVLLPSCFDQVKSYTEQNEEDLDKQLNVLKRTFLEVGSFLYVARTQKNCLKWFKYV